MFNQIKKYFPLIFLMLVSAFAHGYNMFHFPYYENDEGVYMSQAWSVLNESKLAPYTYWYDHAPAGWFFISLWLRLSGGVFTFGESINSGRVFIFILHLLSTFLIYYIFKQTTKREAPGLVAGLIFALSPLGIYFGRRVLLDNIMVFWVLLSLVLIIKKEPSLWRFLFSGICFGIAVLVKESAIVFAPAFLIFALYKSNKKQRLFSTALAVITSGVTISLYPLFALLKGEFFASGSLLGGTTPHVSLLETLKFQANRPGGSFFTPDDSAFWINFLTWLEFDTLLIGVGTFATFLVLILGIIKRRTQPFMLASALLSLGYLFFLARGGVVIEFYVIPLVLLFSLTIGCLVDGISDIGNKLFKDNLFSKIFLPASVAGVILFYCINGFTYLGLNVFTADQTTPQVQALEWTRENASTNDVIVIDNYGWIDLNAPENPSGLVFRNAEWYWKVEKDPEIREQMLDNNIRNIDYIMVTPQMKTDADGSGFLFIPEILRGSKPIVAFNNDKWGVEVWGIRTEENIIERSWRNIKKNFLTDGMIPDLQNNNIVTSENQSIALLQAVWMNDQETFDDIYTWTKSHMQKENMLFSSTYENGAVVNDNSHSGADQNIALALIFASNQWGNEQYLEDAKGILQGLRNESIDYYNGEPYMTAGDWAARSSDMLLNPSYLSPAWYRIFAEVDVANDATWEQLADTSYKVLNSCTYNLGILTRESLPPDWCVLVKSSGRFRAPSEPDPVSVTYSEDASRIPLNIAFDYQWFGSEAAKDYLLSLAVIPDEWQSRGELATSYSHEGFPFERRETVAGYAGNLGYFIVNDEDAAQKIYDDKIEEKFYEDISTSYWEDPNNISTQNIAWLATGLYGKVLKNLNKQ